MKSKNTALSTTNILFRTIEERDIEDLRCWRNDPKVRSQFIYNQEINSTQQKKWYQDYQSRHDDIVWIGYDPKTDKNIGTVALYQIDKEQKTAEIGRLMVAPQRKGQGFGRILMQYAIGRAFEDFGLESVCLDIFYDNLPSMRINLDLGFVPCGVSEVDGRYLIRLSKEKSKGKQQ